MFAYIGLAPISHFLPDAVERDAGGHVKTNDSFETTLPGVSTIGAVRGGFGGTLDHAIEEARRAADAIKARLT